MTHRQMLTAALCSRLVTKSHRTLVRSHCSCTSHGIVFNAARNLDGSGAWSQTTARGNVPCLSRLRGDVWVLSKHERFAGTVVGTRGKERRVDTETRDGGSIELNINSSASLVAVGDRHEVAQVAGSVRQRQNEMGRLGVWSLCKCSQHSYGSRWNTRRARQTRWICPQRTVASRSMQSCATCWQFS